MEPYREMTEEDIRAINSLALDRPNVLNAVCKVMNIYLTTSQNSGDDRWWTVTPSDGSSFTGTNKEVAAYVRGYAVAWLGGRARRRYLVEATHRFMREHIGDQR